MSGKRSRAILLSVPLVLLGLLGLLGLWWGRSSAEAVTPVVESARPPAAILVTQVAAPGLNPLPPPKPPDGTRAWVPGMLYRYAVRADQELTFRQRQRGTDAPPGMRFNIQGEWNVGVVSVRDELIIARVHMVASSFTVAVDGNEALAPEVRRTMTTALELPFFISFDKTGLAKFTHFEKEADVLVRGLLRSLVANSQFVEAGVPRDTWYSEEHDTTGQYRALYQRLATHRFEKQKQSYSHVTTPQGLTPLGSEIRIDVRSISTFELEEDLWTRSLQISERLEVDAGESIPAATYVLSMSLRLLERLQEPTLIGSFDARRAFLGSAAMSSFQGVEQDPLDNYRQVLGGRSFDDMLKELRSLPSEPKARDDVRTRVLEQLRALFMLQPSEALKAPGVIRSGMDPLAASSMLGALSAASTREAIRSLSEVSGDHSISTGIRMDAAAALGMAGEPNPEGVEALRGLTRDADPTLRDTAMLGLGNAAFQMEDTNSGGAEALVHELNSMYRTASSPEQQALALRALGNTRAPSALATLQEALSSTAPQVRQAALEALRNIPDPTADRLLSQYIIGDPTVEVRRVAIFASSFRPLGPLLPALEHALRTDTSDGVRADVIYLLGEMRGMVPEAMPLLRWASENDPNLDLRKVALDFINTPATARSSPGASTP
jgi:HEAT repeat protein